MAHKPPSVLNYARPEPAIPQPGWALYISVYIAGFLVVNHVFQDSVGRLMGGTVNEFHEFSGFCVVLAVLVAPGARWPRLRTSVILPLFAGVVGVSISARALRLLLWLAYQVLHWRVG
jgi:hypothetical protein